MSRLTDGYKFTVGNRTVEVTYNDVHQMGRPAVAVKAYCGMAFDEDVCWKCPYHDDCEELYEEEGVE